MIAKNKFMLGVKHFNKFQFLKFKKYILWNAQTIIPKNLIQHITLFNEQSIAVKSYLKYQFQV
jgi:hypothetical protein